MGWCSNGSEKKQGLVRIHLFPALPWCHQQDVSIHLHWRCPMRQLCTVILHIGLVYFRPPAPFGWYSLGNCSSPRVIPPTYRLVLTEELGLETEGFPPATACPWLRCGWRSLGSPWCIWMLRIYQHTKSGSKRKSWWYYKSTSASSLSFVMRSFPLWSC